MAVAGKIKTCGSLFLLVLLLVFLEVTRGDTFKNQRCHLLKEKFVV